MKHPVLFFMLLILAISARLPAYQNPISVPSEWPTAGQPDPRITKFLGYYYLYATKEAGTGNKLRAWRSTDLVNWTLASNDLTPDHSWEHAWAPEVYYHTDGVFYMIHSGPEGDPSIARHRLFTSSWPWGPFSLVNSDFNPSNNIDGSFFRNDDGQLYLFYADGNNPSERGIHYRTMSSPLNPDGTPVYLGNCIVDALPAGHDFEKWTEGPQLFKANGQYYLSYCGNLWNDTTYQSHIARGASIAALSPQDNNPAIVSTTGSYTGTGHNDVFLGPNLQQHYTVYHGLDETGAKPYLYRQLFLDRVDFDDAGRLLVDGGNAPSLTPRPDPDSPDFADYFERATVNPVGHDTWTAYGAGSWGTWYDADYWGLLWGDNRGQGTAWAFQYASPATSEDYVAEYNLKLRELGPTSPYPKYGAVCSFSPTENSGLALFFDQPNSLLAIYAFQDGTGLGAGGGWSNASLPADFNYDYWHTIRVEKEGTAFQIYVDDMLKAERDYAVDIGGGYCGYVLEDCWAEFGYMAFTSQPRTVPNAPSQPVAEVTGTDAIRWSWQDNAADEEGFYVYLASPAGETPLLQATLPENSTSWTADSLDANTSASFQVSAFKTIGGESARTATLTTWTLAKAPARPLRHNVTSQSLTLAISPEDGNSSATTYGLEWTAPVEKTGWVGGDGQIHSAPFFQSRSQWGQLTLEGLTPLERYALRLTAKNGAGRLSGPGPALEFRTLPPCPAGVRLWEGLH